MAMSQAEMVQKARVRALSDGLQVYRIADGVYVVPAKSNPGEAYTVTVQTDGQPSCTCPGATNRGVCKHQEAVRFRYLIDSASIA